MRPRVGNFSLFLVLCIAFLDWMGIGLVYPMFSSMIFNENFTLLPPDTTEAWRGFWLGILLAAMPFVQFLSSPILGALSDQKGRKPCLMYPLLISLFGYFLSALGVWLPSLVIILVGRIFVGVGAGNASVVAAVMADISTLKTKAKYFGLLNMAYGFGFMVGPFLGGVLSTLFLQPYGGYATPFWFAGIMSLLNFIFLGLTFKETHHALNPRRLSLMLGIANLKKAFRFPTLRILFTTLFIFCCAWSFYWEFIPIVWIKDYGLNVAQVGNLYAYAAGFYAISSGFLIRPIVNRFTASKVLFYSLVISGLYIYLMLTHMPLGLLWLYLPLQQYLLALLFPTATAAVSNTVGEEMQGETLGISQSIISAAFALSPLFSGLLLGLGHDIPVIIGGTGMLLAAVIMMRYQVIKGR